MLVGERIVAGDVHGIACVIQDFNFLNSGTDKPCVNIFLAGSVLQFEDGSVVQAVGFDTDLVTVNQRHAVQIFSDHDVSAFCVGQSAQSEQALSIVQDGVDVLVREQNGFGDESCINRHASVETLNQGNILFSEDLSFFQQFVVDDDIFSQNTADESGSVAGGNGHEIRFVEFGAERIGVHVAALVQHFTQSVALVTANMGALFHEQIAVDIQNVVG